MAARKAVNTIVQPWRQWNCTGESNSPESHSKGSCRSRILEIEEAERAERAALLHRTERLCSSQDNHGNSVLGRLGFSVQQDTPPPPQPPASKRGPESPLRGARAGPHFSPLNVGDNKSGQSELFHEKKLHLGSQMAVFACKVAKLAAKSRRPSPAASMASVDSLSSVETHTPDELRAISQINSFSPSPPPVAAARRPSRLPVMYGGGEGKVGTGGIRLQSLHNKVDRVMERLEAFHCPSPPPTTSPRVPKPQSVAKPNKTAPRHGTTLPRPAVHPPAVHPPAVHPPARHPPAVYPPARHPPAVHPPAVHPPARHPPAVHPPAVHPPARHPPAVYPPAVHPPAVHPPAVHPPARHPPAVYPPAVHPPAVHPPAVQPPAHHRPAVHPPAVHSPAVYPPAVHPPAVHSPAVYPPAVHPPAVHSPAVHPPAVHPSARRPPAVHPPARRPPACCPPARHPPAVHPPAVPSPAVHPPAHRPSGIHPSKAKDNGGSRAVLKPLGNPSECLWLCFRQLDSDDWEKKIDGLKSIRALVQHHQQVLLSKLHEVCLVLTKEVANLRSAVACEAMETVGELHTYLGRAMDPEAERTGRALLLKLAQTTSPFIHQHANAALDALVDGCSPRRVMRALFNTGLNHCCPAVRGSTAQHLHQLAAIIGDDRMLSAGKMSAERFLTAASKMSLDAAPEVRRYGQELLQRLSKQSEFVDLWNKIIPVKDRRPLDKVLKKMRQ